MEKILEIKDYVEPPLGLEGYEVITDKQHIKLSIDNYQSCCENWGYFWCNDNPQDFIGTSLIDVTLTDVALNEVHMKKNELDPKSKYFSGGVMFVNLNTDKGVLQFVAYNEHNGYYGHEAKVECAQLNNSEYL